MAQGHTRSGSDNLVLPYRKKLPVFLTALPPAAMPSHDSQTRETTHSHPAELTTWPGCPQGHIDANISVSHLESASTNKSSKGIGISLTHRRDRKKQAHNQYVTWALLVSLGRSKLPVFPLNILVLVFNWFISFPIKLHRIWFISFLNKVVNTNRKRHILAQMQI